MRLDGFDLNLLVVFEALLTEQSVSRAASRLHVVQSAVSSALKRLREQFEDDLFVLVGSRMVPTPFAANLERDVSNVLQHSKSIIGAKSRFDPHTSTRRFSIVARAGFAQSFGLALYHRIREEAPQVELSQYILKPQRPSGHQMAANILLQRSYDILLVGDSDASPHFPREFMFDVKWCCVAWTHNSQVGDELTMDDFLRLEHVGVEFPADELEPLINTIIRNMQLDLKIGPVVGDHTLLPGYLIGTDRIALIPLLLAQYAAQYFPLRILKCPVDFPVFPIVMQWNPAADGDLALEWFKGCIRDILPDLRPIFHDIPGEPEDPLERHTATLVPTRRRTRGARSRTLERSAGE